MTLFATDTPLPISEQTIASAHASLFLLGRYLAWLNAEGLFLRDAQRGLVFSTDRGTWLVDWECLDQRRLSPETAREQMQSLYAAMGKEPWLAFLSGYSQKAIHWIDPVQTGFTEALLRELVNGSWLLSRSGRLDLEKVLAACGCRAAFEESFLVLRPHPLSGQSVTDEELVLATAVLVLTGVKAGDWVTLLEGKETNQEVVKMLTAFFRREHTGEDRFTGLLPQLLGIKSPRQKVLDMIRRQPVSSGVLLHFIGAVWDGSWPEGNVFESMDRLAPFLKMALAREATLPQEKPVVSEAIADGLDYLSGIADEQGNTIESIQLAQSAQVILQKLAPCRNGAEERLSRAECREEGHRWRNLRAVDDRDTLFTLGGYASTASLTDMKYFSASGQSFEAGQGSNQLWSAIWRAIDRQRWMLRLMHGFLVSPAWESEFTKDFSFLLRHNVKQFQHGLVQHLRAVEMTLRKETPCVWANCWLTEAEDAGSGTTFVLRSELMALNALDQALESGELDESAVALFHQLIRVLDTPHKMFRSSVSQFPVEATSHTEEPLPYPENPVADFNAWVAQYHQGETNLLDGFVYLIDRADEVMLRNYCMLMALLVSVRQEQWDTALRMIKRMVAEIASAYDLPGIPLAYHGYGEEILSVEPILEVLRQVEPHFLSDPAVRQLMDRYRERKSVE